MLLLRNKAAARAVTTVRQAAGPAAGRSCTTSRRKRNSAAGRPPVAVEVSPVGSTKRGGLDQAAEVLLVQAASGDRLDGALQFGEREFARHQLEHHRAVFQLGAQPRDRGREDAAVIEPHRFAQSAGSLAAQRRLRGRRDAPPRPVRPRTAARSGRAPFPRPTGSRRRRSTTAAARGGRARAPARACRSAPPIPRSSGSDRSGRGYSGRCSRQSSQGKKRYQGSKPAPAARRAASVVGHPREREIADRDHVRAGVARPRMPAAIAEGVELLDIADVEPVCAATQARRPISKVRCESGSNGPNGSPARVAPLGGFAGDEDRRLLGLDGDDRRGQPDLDRRQRTIAHPCHAGYS